MIDALLDLFFGGARPHKTPANIRAERDVAKRRAQWDDTPYTEKITRQQHRRRNIRICKALHRMYLKEKLRAKTRRPSNRVLREGNADRGQQER